MRYSVMKQLTTYNDIEIYDLLGVDWSKFTYNEGYKEHMVNVSEVNQPYLVPVQHYGDVDYEDAVLLINSVPNPLNLFTGQVLKIPTIADIRLFLAQY